MPKLSEFNQSSYNVTLHYDGLAEPVITTVKPFANLQAYLDELENLPDDDVGRLKLYEIICARLSSWQNVRDEIPASVTSLDSVPACVRNLYSKAENDGDLFYLDGNIAAVSREVDIPLEPQALLDFNLPFALGFDIVKRSVSEVDTKKRSGARR